MMPRSVTALALVSLLAACASASQTIVTTEGEKIEPEDIMDLEVVAQKCSVPDLKTYFAFDSDEVAEHENLDRLAACLTTGPLQGTPVVLVGHTDSVGTEAYNEKLGLSRAKQVAGYLIDKGVDKKKIKFSSRGKSGAKDEPYPEDRRVDINLLVHAGSSD